MRRRDAAAGLLADRELDAVQPGGRYALNENGREVLKAWRDSRAANPTN